MKKIKNENRIAAGRLTRKIGVVLIIFASFPGNFSTTCFSREQVSQPAVSVQDLRENPKILAPDGILLPFMEGKATTRVIIGFNLPKFDEYLQNFANPEVQAQIKADVALAQDLIINAMDANEVRVTNRFTYVSGFSAEVTLQGLSSLVNNQDVAFIEEDMLMEVNMAQGIPLINASAIRNTYDGTGIAIAICDTGIDYTHPDFGGTVVLQQNTKVIGGIDTGQNDNDPMDGHGHGTACAGIAAGDVPTLPVGDYIGGVAHNARLYALKITNTANGGTAWDSDAIDAWDWCIAHQNDDPNNPIMIISHSFGGGKYNSSSSCDNLRPSYAQAAACVKAVGITIFAASGNDGYCDAISAPACLSDVNSVGQVYDLQIGINRSVCISGNSCVATSGTNCTFCPNSPATCWYCNDNPAFADLVVCSSNSANFLDFFGPGYMAHATDIVGVGGLSNGNYITDFSGTSAACPYAAGAAAILQIAAKDKTGVYLTPDQVNSVLSANGNNVTDPKATPTVTKPRVNLGNSVAVLDTIDVNLCGPVSGMLKSGETYNVVCDIVVPTNLSLTIESGAIINNLEDYSFTANGALTWNP